MPTFIFWITFIVRFFNSIFIFNAGLRGRVIDVFSAAANGIRFLFEKVRVFSITRLQIGLIKLEDVFSSHSNMLSVASFLPKQPDTSEHSRRIRFNWFIFRSLSSTWKMHRCHFDEKTISRVLWSEKQRALLDIIRGMSFPFSKLTQQLEFVALAVEAKTITEVEKFKMLNKK